MKITSNESFAPDRAASGVVCPAQAGMKCHVCPFFFCVISDK